MIGTAILLCILIGILAALVLGIHLYAYIYIYLSNRSLRKQLALRGRVMTLAQAKKKIQENQGMIVVDNPTLGWNVNRVWWSPTIETSTATSEACNEFIRPNQTKENHDDLSFPISKQTEENYDKLIDPSLGCASLITGFVFTQRTKAYLKRHFDLSDCLYIFTGGVKFVRKLRERKQSEHALPISKDTP
jgi:hypothetical protein